MKTEGRVAELERQVRDLTERLAALTGPSAGEVVAAPAADSRSLSRRGLIAAAAGVAGAAVVGLARPAGATTGDVLKAGMANTAGSTTSLTTSVDTGLAVTTTSTSSSAVGLYAKGPKVGALGEATATTGYQHGVYGVAASSLGVGVRGDSKGLAVWGWSTAEGGTGVKGTSTGTTSGYGVYSEGQLKATGRSYLAAPNSAPTDANLDAGSISFYLVEASNQLKVRVRYSSGAYKTGTVTLA